MFTNASCYTTSSETHIVVSSNFVVLWLGALPLVVLFVVTLSANGAVISMYLMKAKLRKCRNTYIMSLAVADFLIGLTLPISILETLSEGWISTDEWCTVFLTVKCSLYYVTILSIILITGDRWWSVNFPFSYRIRRSKTRALTLSGLVWILSFAIHFPTVAVWNMLHRTTASQHNFCRVPYEYNPGFTISASVIEFFIPLLLLVSLNTGLYIKLVKRRNSKKLRRSLSMLDSHSVFQRKSSSESENTNNSEDVTDVLLNFAMKGNNNEPSTRRGSMLLANQYKKLSNMDIRPNTHFGRLCTLSQQMSYRRWSIECSNLIASNTYPRKQQMLRKASRASVSSKAKSNDDMVRDYLVRQDNKAVLSLGLLVAMFVICWTPTVLSDIVYSICPSKVPIWVMQVSQWVLALNTAVNPFLYGIGSSDFRRVAMSWLCYIDSRKVRILESMMYNPIVQPCDVIALKDVDTTGSGQKQGDQAQFV